MIWRKKINIDGLKEYLSTSNNINEVVVMGYSLEKVDEKYFFLTEEIVKPKKWIVYYHDNKLLEIVKRYEFLKHAELIKW